MNRIVSVVGLRASSSAARCFGLTASRLSPVFYAKSHEWVDIQGTTATVGISNHAQEELGEAVFVQLPEVGLALQAEEVFGAVESVKATSECYSPCSGVVSEVNEGLADKPELLNEAAEGAGWMIKLKDVVLPEGLMTAEEYTKFVAEGGH
eukprot:NODE_5376_length_683_cov_67.402208_g5002_i0.p1 GENE.NODE_5376_length_683_cov_67.402208_g5002_i0~~NODE_5376_length_683_cov_67.402208_g5002_i0.p1  ORF type:complete len:151 (+),score=33.24 NODE_5376_length_683_cov_67.402208_g5002_i0:116-568(+)